MLERDWMKKWVETRLKTNKSDYWLRIPDSAEGTKPFDGVLMTSLENHGTTVPLAIAMEFKVWRKNRPFDYSSVESHQLRELLRWEKAGGVAWIMVLHEKTGRVEVFHPSRKLLERLLKKRK